MKIALFSTFYPFRGGIAQFGAALYRAFEKNHEVRAYTFSRQYPSILFPGKTQFVEAGDQADVIPSIRLIDSVNPLTVRKCAQEIKQFNPELYISQYWMSFFSFPKAKLAASLSPEVKKIAILHNVIPHEPRFFDRAAARYFLKKHDGFVVMSESVQADLLRLRPDARFIRLNHPNYVHFKAEISREDALRNLGLAANKHYLLFFGFIRDYKGLDVLIQSLTLLPENIELIVAGEVYGSFKKYEELLNDLGLRTRVHLFNKYIADAEVAQFFSAADLCVLPYRSATQSGIVSIAHEFFLPVLVSNVGGLAEYVQNGKDGIVIDKAEPTILAQEITSYFDGTSRQKMKEFLKKSEKGSDWDGFVKEIISFAGSI